MSTWQEIADGGRLLHVPQFFDTAAADHLFDWLRDHVPWEQLAVRGRPFPRMNAWYADPGLRWSYSGVTHRGEGWHPRLEVLRQELEVATGLRFNSLLLNRYRHGQDSIGYHADAEPELGRNPAVATLSLGETRRFLLRHPASGERRTYELGHGSLFLMAGSTQHHWLHALPKTEVPVGERISLTFRFLFPTD
ncbi:MAG: alkylated repair protein [Moraxellaceae bacterium]|jgi:alkylated DNA repair dioxygenase AlkB|nr:alkylated repair protein [Moraxellaceae bacterium]MDF3031450.1 alkylated repair protein [Moraxellaceae bacterium]